MAVKWMNPPEADKRTPFEKDMDEIAKTQDKHLDDDGMPRWALIFDMEWASKATALRDKYPDFEFLVVTTPGEDTNANLKNKMIFTRFRGPEYGLEVLRAKRERKETRGRKKGSPPPAQAADNIIRPLYGDTPPPPPQPRPTPKPIKKEPTAGAHGLLGVLDELGA